MRKQLTVFTIGLLVLVFLISGCGGGGDGASSESTATAKSGSTSADTGQADAGSEQGASEAGAISKAAFVKKANAICKATAKGILLKASSVIQQGQESKGFDQAAAEARLVSTTLAPGLQGEVEELRSLGVPSDGEGQVDELLAAIQRLVGKAEAHPETIAKQGPKAYVESEKLADTYGLTSCPYG